jgi:hypothetical protein
MYAPRLPTMSTVKEMWAKTDTYTARASEISRTLCLSGLAVIWIFRTPTVTGSFLAPTLLWVSGLLVLALLLDLIQYVVGALRTENVARQKEKALRAAKQPPDTVVHYPANHPHPMKLIWRAKISVVLLAWTILLIYVAHAAVTASLPTVGK